MEGIIPTSANVKFIAGITEEITHLNRSQLLPNYAYARELILTGGESCKADACRFCIGALETYCDRYRQLTAQTDQTVTINGEDRDRER